MSAESLLQALAELGVRGDIEARGALAIFAPTPDAAVLLRDPAIRARAVAIAPEHGFTNIALEVVERSQDGAPLHSD